MLTRHHLPKRLRRSLKPSPVFDRKDFLASAGIGRTLHRFKSKQVIFSHGGPADTVFYIQQGRSASV